MRATEKKFADLGVQVLTVVAHDSLWIKSLPGAAMPEASPHPLLVDPTATVSATYGAAFQKKKQNNWLNRQLTYVIDRRGVIRHRLESNHRRISYLRRSDELLEAVRKVR